MDRESVHSSSSAKRIIPTARNTAIIPVNSNGALAAAKQEEWTTSRKVVNHKTKEVETRVKRQIIMEDGKVIADSGPQVTTKTKEDQKQEESEQSNHKNVGDIDVPPGPGYVAIPGGHQVVSEKTETHQSSREAKEENLQYHDESFKELTGLEIHRKALQAPNDLINIDSDNEDSSNRPKGKLVHYSSKSHKINDNEEVKETSRLGRDGNMVTETTRTHHHEEFDDDELPEDNQPQRKALPESSTETTRNVEYLKDYEKGFDNFPKVMNGQNVRAVESGRTELNRDVSQRNVYSRNEENVKNTSTTSRWLDDHFGDSDESDIVETSRTRTGNNVINVSRTGRTSTPVSDFQSMDRSKKRSQKVTKTPQKYKTTATYYVRDSHSRSPSPDYNRPSSQMKGNASVQASLSDDEHRFESDFKSNTEKREQKKTTFSDVRSETPNRPEKTFYFGDDNYQQKEMQSDRQIIEDYLHKQKYQKSSVEKENTKVNDYNNNEDWKGTGYVSANISTKAKSTLNDRVINDSSTNENFERSFKDNREKSDVEHNLNRFMNWDDHYKSLKSGDDDNWTSNKSKTNEYIHPVIQDDFYSSRRDPSTRQRNFDSYVSPPPTFTSNTDYKYRYSKSPSPPSSPTGTWTKSRRSPTHYRSTSPTNDFPSFSPLSINPSQIKSFTDSYSNGRNHS